LIYPRAFNHAPVGIALIGVTAGDFGRIVQANRALAALVASTPEELTGRSLCELIHTEDRGYAVDEFARMIDRAGGLCEGEGRLVAANGVVRWVHVDARLLPTDWIDRALAIIHITQIAERWAGSPAEG
jgi:PAS domain S-box-containing protein